MTKERHADFYSTMTYFCSKLIVDLVPLRVIPAIFYCAISYWMVGFQSDWTLFINFTTIVCLTNIVATMSCFMISAASTSVNQANLISVVFLTFTMLYGGLLLSNGSAGFVRYLSFVNYAFEALMIKELTGQLFLVEIDTLATTAEVSGELLLDILES